MSSPGLPPRNRLPFLIAVLVVLLVGVVSVSLTLDRVAGRNSAAGLPTPEATATPRPTPAPSPTPTPVPQLAFADCGAVHFGAALPPVNPPADPHTYSAAPPLTIDSTKLYLATITTARGTIALCLQPALAPNTVNNFITLARNHFYDGLTFHRVVTQQIFIIQGGDPTGSGSGGPGYKFNDEPVRQSYVSGALAMANSGPNTNGSQFFICTGDDSAQFQPLYNLFGKVQSGLDVAQKIVQGDKMTSVSVAQQP